MAPRLETASTPLGLTLGEPVQGRGGQNCAIADGANRALVFQLGDASDRLTSPYGAGVFGGAAEQAAAEAARVKAEKIAAEQAAAEAEAEASATEDQPSKSACKRQRATTRKRASSADFQASRDQDKQ